MGHGMVGLFALTISACVPLGPQPSYYGQQPQPYAASGQAASGLTCLQLFDCFQTCQDGTCIQSCLGQADANVQAAASAAMQCSSQKCGAGAGAECLAQQCGAEVQTCTGTVATVAAYEAPQQQPVTEQLRPGQPHTTANILPWMVGDWIGTNHQFTFYADGRVRRSSGVALSTEKGTYGCASIVNDIGTVTQEGDVLVMRFETTDVNHCHERSTEPALTVRYRIDWRQPYGETAFSQLLLRDLDCKRGDSMYCDNTMRRR